MSKKQQQLMAFEGESVVDIFGKNEIRKKFCETEWWFSVKDAIEALIETSDGMRYSRGLRDRDEGLKTTWAQITRTLPFETKTRGMQETTFVNMEGMMRIVQSVPTKKAEPFKKWLAKVGFERIQEIQDPK